MISWLNRLTIRAKIMLAFGFVLTIVVGLGLLSLNRLSAINDRAADVRDNWLTSTGVLGELLAAVEDARIYQARSALATSDQARLPLAAEARARMDAAEKLRASYEPLITRGTDDERLIRAFDKAWADYMRVARPIMAGTPARAGELFNADNSATMAIAKTSISEDLAFNSSEGRKVAAAGGAIYADTKLEVLAVIVICSIASLLLRRKWPDRERIVADTRHDADHAPACRGRPDRRDQYRRPPG